GRLRRRLGPGRDDHQLAERTRAGLARADRRCTAAGPPRAALPRTRGRSPSRPTGRYDLPRTAPVLRPGLPHTAVPARHRRSGLLNQLLQALHRFVRGDLFALTAGAAADL